jgi:hypothetical protein
VAKSRGFVPLTLIVLASGSLFRFASSVSPDTYAQGGAAAPAASAPAESAASPALASEESDALDLLAESFGLDFTLDGLKKQAVASVNALRPGGRSSWDERQSALAYLNAFVTLPIRDKGDPQRGLVANARGAVAALKARVTPDEPAPLLSAAAAADLDQLFAAYFDDEALRAAHATDEAKLLAQNFERIDKSLLKLAVLQQVAAARRTDVRCLVATLPDPIDSFTGWQFDPMLDSIAQGIAESDYILDRFHFPDSDVEATTHSTTEMRERRVHDAEPSVVIYRRHDREETQTAAEQGRLVLLIVHENPAAGVHTRALENAVRLVTQWTAIDKVIRILGPTFSGSSDSLGQALSSFAVRQVIPRGYSVRVLSGSATDRGNKKAIERYLDPQGYDGQVKLVPVHFAATVNSDDDLLSRLRLHVEQLGWSFPMAVMYEGNTQYGREMIRYFQEEGTNVLQLPFPLNISRLRATGQPDKPGAAAWLSMPSRFRPLDMESAGNPSDQLPQFSPKTSAAYVELAIAATLQTMNREHVGTVALLATDPRDKLYLAQQIARYTPDVSIVTAESDSLYVHPDYSGYLKGALVVSTYPLYNGNQRWSHSFEGRSLRRQFPNGSSHGIYNATVALLNYDEDGHPIGEKAPKLLEYGPPAQECAGGCRPPVWISVVGRSGVAPVRPYMVEDREGYVFALNLGDPAAHDSGTRQPPIAPATFPSPLFGAVFGLVAVASLGLWGIAIREARRRHSLGMLTEGDDRLQASAYFLVCVIGLLLVESFFAALCVIRLRVEVAAPPDADFVPALMLAIAVVALVALADVARRAVAQIAAHARQVRHVIDPRRASTWVGAAVAAIAVVGIVGLVRYEWRHAVAPSSESIGFVARAVDLGSGACPTLPVLFLGAALILWGATELARLRRPDVALAGAAVEPLVEQTINGDVQSLRPAWALFNRSILAVPAGLLVVPVAAIVTVGVFAYDPIVSPLVTIEGTSYGRFVAATLLTLQLMLSLALLQFVCLWLGLRQLLIRMACHPLVDAYDRVPRSLSPIGLLPRVPALMELQQPVAQWQRLVYATRLSPAGAAVIPADATALMDQFHDELRRSPSTPWSSSKTWKILLEAARYTATGLQAEWKSGMRGHHRAAHAAAAGAGVEGHPAVAPLAAAIDPLGPPPSSPEHEDVIAMAMAFLVRDAVARLGYNLVFVTGGVLLVFCSFTLFPFRAHQRLEALAWSYIGLTFAAILTVMVQIKRNDVIARLTSSTPGQRTTWDFEFVLKLVVFGLLPLLTLFATQFPDIGGTLLRWLEPVEKVLP